MSIQRQRKTPILPAGTEYVIGTIVAALVLWLMNSLAYPIWAIILGIILSYVACVYGFNVWTDADRMYAQSMQLSKEIGDILKGLEGYVSQIRNAQAARDLREGINSTKVIENELLELRIGAMYSGFSEVSTWVKRLNGTVPEYVSLQNHPAKAGDDYAQLMQVSEEAIAGYREWSAGMLQRVEKGDIFSMSVNARLLRSLLGQNASNLGSKKE